MANIRNLLTLIPENKTNEDFTKAIFPHMANETSLDKTMLNKQLMQLMLGKSIKYETLDRIAEETGKDYNQILNYENRK